MRGPAAAMETVDWLFSNRVIGTRLQPQRLTHLRAFVFTAYGRKSKPSALRVVVDSENTRKADMIHSGDTGIRTATMAKIYAGQGHYVIAAEIYRHLLRENPDRRDWADALAQIEAKLAAQAESRFRDPAGRLAEWIGLMLSYRRLLDLRDIRRQIAQKNIGGRK